MAVMKRLPMHRMASYRRKLADAHFTSCETLDDDARDAAAAIHARRVTELCSMSKAAERPSKEWSHKATNIISPAGRD